MKKAFFVVGQRDEKTLRALIEQLPPYRLNFSDQFKSYLKVFRNDDNHIIGKGKPTNLNESLHCQMRHYLARLKRKTLSYSKSSSMLIYSIAILFVSKHSI